MGGLFWWFFGNDVIENDLRGFEIGILLGVLDFFVVCLIRFWFDVGLGWLSEFFYCMWLGLLV